VLFAVVVEVVDVEVTVAVEVTVLVTVDVEVVELVCVEVEFVSAAASATGAEPTDRLADDADCPCAYAAIPPEIRTSIAAIVRICSFPALTCMFPRIYGAREAI